MILLNIYVKSVEPDFKVETKNEVYSNKYDNDILRRFMIIMMVNMINDIPSNEVDN